MTIRVERETMEYCPCCGQVTLHEAFPLVSKAVSVLWCRPCSHVRTRDVRSERVDGRVRRAAA